MSFSAELSAILRTISLNKEIAQQLKTKDILWEKIQFQHGDGKPQLTVQGSLGPGRSANAATAETNAGISNKANFNLTYGEDFSAIELVEQDIEGTRGPDAGGALVDLVTEEYDRAEDALCESLTHNMYRDGTATRGQRASASGAVITLSEPDDALNFYKGQNLVFAATKTGALRDSGATLTVLSVDIEGGTVTCTANASTITGFADSDYIFVEGDAANGGSTIVFPGFDAWFATAATVAAEGTWYGETRANFPLQTVAGTVVDHSSTGGGTVYGKLFSGMRKIYRASGGMGGADLVVLPDAKWQQLANEADNGNFVANRSTTELGKQTLKITFGTKMTCDVGMSVFASPDTAYVLNTKKTKLVHLKKNIVSPVVTDEKVMWERSNKTFKAMLSSYCVLAPDMPASMGRILL